MKRLNPLGRIVKDLSFDSDGIYTVSSSHLYDIKYWDVSEEEIKELEDNIKKIKQKSIVDGDIIYFDKNTSFPKLMLNQLNVDVKRTIKIDKCTKIVVNEDDILSASDLGRMTSGYLILTGGIDESDYTQVFFITDSHIEQCNENGLTLDLMQKYFPGIWMKATALSKRITENSITITNSNPDKLVTLQQMVKYLNSKLQSLDEESANTIIGLFKAGPEEKKLAINMVASFDISNIIYDICDAIGSGQVDFSSSTKNSINYKYFRTLIGENPSEIVRSWRYSYYSRKIASNLFHSQIITNSQKLKAWKMFWFNTVGSRDYSDTLTDRGKINFDRYNMPYSYDPERETSASDREVEEDGVLRDMGILYRVNQAVLIRNC